jgi:hypothetical protein
LEEKIESLVTLLAAAHGTAVKSDDSSPSQISDQSVHSTLANTHNHPPALFTLEVPAQNQENWNTQTQSHLSVNAPSFQNGCSSRPPLVSSPAPQPSLSFVPLNHNILHDEDDLLRAFKEQFAVRFPFILLPPHATSSELRTQKPFLHRAIMMVASQGKRMQQIEMAKEISMDIAAALILRGERSLDMLQALVTYNAWFVKRTPYFVNSTAPLKSPD